MLILIYLLIYFKKSFCGILVHEHTIFYIIEHLYYLNASNDSTINTFLCIFLYNCLVISLL